MVSPKKLWVCYVNTRKQAISAVGLKKTTQCDSDRNLHKLLLVIFPEVLMKYFEPSF